MRKLIPQHNVRDLSGCRMAPGEIPRRRDGQVMDLIILPSGLCYIDSHTYFDHNNEVHRSGQWHELHIHKFQEYGMIDHDRCVVCGLVRRKGAQYAAV